MLDIAPKGSNLAAVDGVSPAAGSASVDLGDLNAVTKPLVPAKGAAKVPAANTMSPDGATPAVGAAHTQVGTGVGGDGPSIGS